MGYGTEPQVKTGEVAATDPQAVPAAAVRQDVAGALHSDGEFTLLQVDSSGNLRVVSAGGAPSGYTTDDPSTGTDTGTLTLAIRADADGTLVSADGDFAPLQVDSSGYLKVVLGGSGGGVVSVDDNGGSLTVDGTVTANAGTGPWPVTDNGASLTVDGTVTADAGTGPWPVTDNGGSLTVDGTVTTTPSGTQDVTSAGATIDSGSASVTTSSAVIKAADANRRTLTLTNLGSDYVWIGDAAIAPDTGLRLAPSQTVMFDRSPTAAFYAVASSGSQDVAWFTEED